MKRDSQVTGNVGLYWTLAHGLERHATARNARGVDIIAYNRDCSRMVSIQVKTLSKRNPVPLGTSLDKVMGDFWVVVNNVVSDPQTYVLVPQEVKDLAHRGEKDGRVSYWLQPSAYCVEQFHERWNRIAQPDRALRLAHALLAVNAPSSVTAKPIHEDRKGTCEYCGENHTFSRYACASTWPYLGGT